jgi:YD repeat-containing protein
MNAVYEPTVGNTCFLWGYKGQFSVAQIENATYSEVVAQIQGGQATIDAIASSSTLSDTNKAKIDELRKKLPQAQVTTYTYRPLVGVQTITSPNGFTIYYDYDDFGRLKETYFIEDNVRKSIEKYEYHYKN